MKHTPIELCAECGDEKPKNEKWLCLKGECNNQIWWYLCPDCADGWQE